MRRATLIVMALLLAAIMFASVIQLFFQAR
jgi:hypothetical protein